MKAPYSGVQDHPRKPRADSIIYRGEACGDVHHIKPGARVEPTPLNEMILFHIKSETVD